MDNTEGKGQLDKIENVLKDSQKDIDRSLFLAKKTERLAVAIYKVTDFLSEEEPLRIKLRKTALEAVSTSSDLLKTSIEGRDDSLISLIPMIKKMNSFLEVAQAGNYASKINFAILEDEYNSVMNMIKSVKLDGYNIRDNLYVTRQDVSGALPKLSIPNDADFQQLKDEEINIVNSIGRDNVSIERKNFSESKKRKNLEKKETNVLYRADEDKDKRKKLITNFVKDNGEVSIKDILTVPELSNRYSEKTIQRELVLLVNNRILKKEGERRWSRYSLN